MSGNLQPRFSFTSFCEWVEPSTALRPGSHWVNSTPRYSSKFPRYLFSSYKLAGQLKKLAVPSLGWNSMCLICYWILTAEIQGKLGAELASGHTGNSTPIQGGLLGQAVKIHNLYGSFWNSSVCTQLGRSDPRQLWCWFSLNLRSLRSSGWQSWPVDHPRLPSSAWVSRQPQSQLLCLL